MDDKEKEKETAHVETNINGGTNEKALIDKLSDVLNHLESRDDLPTKEAFSNMQDTIKEMRTDIDELQKEYNQNDKQMVTFLARLDTLEKEISEYEKSDGVDSDRARGFLNTAISALLGALVAYLFNQIEKW